MRLDESTQKGLEGGRNGGKEGKRQRERETIELNKNVWGTSTLTGQEKWVIQRCRLMKSSKAEEMPGKKNDTESKKMF